MVPGRQQGADSCPRRPSQQRAVPRGQACGFLLSPICGIKGPTVMYLLRAAKSSMKTCIFIPPPETSIIEEFPFLVTRRSTLYNLDGKELQHEYAGIWCGSISEQNARALRWDGGEWTDFHG